MRRRRGAGAYVSAQLPILGRGRGRVLRSPKRWINGDRRRGQVVVEGNGRRGRRRVRFRPCGRWMTAGEKDRCRVPAAVVGHADGGSGYGSTGQWIRRHGEYFYWSG